jgi:phosphoenolpyruvate carboxykinase (ATP)
VEHDEAVKRLEAADKEGRDAYQISQTVTGVDACKTTGLHFVGITNPTTVYRNLSFGELLEHEVANNEGVLVDGCEYGPTFCVDTGKYTGRSPGDRFIVKNPGSETEANIDWNKINQPISPDVWKVLYDKAVAHMNTRDTVYVFDGIVGASPQTSRKIRFVHEMAWQQHFVTNMFIRPTTLEGTPSGNVPGSDVSGVDFTVINCCSQTVENWRELTGLKSETAVVFNVEERTAVIFGTWYGGENKKGIFSLMNYWLPMSEGKGHLPMHCSANVHPETGGTSRPSLPAYSENI